MEMRIKIKKLYKKLNQPSIYCFILLGISLILNLILGKNQSFLIINQYHSSFFDFFFKYLTNLGDGLIWLALLIISYLYFKKRTVIVLTNFTLSTIITQFLKRVVFSHELRPSSLIEKGFSLHFVEGVAIHSSNSFPSGHTVTAFAVAFTLILMLGKKNRFRYYIISLAFLIGCSRIYLAQHFPIDVIAGAFIGIASTYLSLYVLHQFKRTRNSSLEEVPDQKPNLDFYQTLF